MERLYIHTEEVHNKRSASIVLPLLFEIIKKPASVLDVGCGTATWLSVCSDLGISDFIGVDGNYVDEELLLISKSKFIDADLRNAFSLKRKFELIICLEVAEHLPPASAKTLVENLVQHGEVILFSAAIPGQGGQNHLNEQWPEYWQELFKEQGYYYHDVIRPGIWDNKNIDWWYRQNMFLVTKSKPETPNTLPRSIVHPKLLEQKIRDAVDYNNSLIEGKQGLWVSIKIILNALLYKFTQLFEGYKK